MEKNFTANEIREAKQAHLFDGNTLYVVDHNDEVYGYYRYGGGWFHKANFWDYYESTEMLSYLSPITKDEAAELYESWRAFNETASRRLDEAICFATEQHAGQTRKGTNLPYILHPLEVLQILYSMRADVELLIAGVLHDTIEDTDTTLEEIRERFGRDVAELVASNSEDKSKTWDERKQHTLEMLPSADHRVKQLILADKLSNLRSIAYDYRMIGDKLWERFNAPASKQAWYYGGIDDALNSLQYTDCKDVYWEYVGLFKDVFVKYYLDEKTMTLHQVCLSGEHYCLRQSFPEFWVPYEEFIAKEVSDQVTEFKQTTYEVRRYYSTRLSAGDMTQLSRKHAEYLEDEWVRNSTFCG